jgi:enoyl-CoA hydratase/carnithine racemase
VNRVVAAEDLADEAEAMARKLASLPQTTVRLNKMLVNRVYELAGFREALAYRDDPALEAVASRTGDDTVARERLSRLTQEGWGAFKRNRDTMHEAEPR